VRDLGSAVPLLVRELLDGERAHRMRAAQAAAAPAAPSATPAGAPLPPPLLAPPPPPPPPKPAGPVKCRCLAIQSTYVPGELVADDAELRFEPSPTSAVKYKWRYRWDRVQKVERTNHGVNPALLLASSTNDEVVVYFNLGDERDRCLAAIEKRRAR
jgi:hypothetical protein